MSSREVKTFKDLPDNVQNFYRLPSTPIHAGIVYAYNAGVRAGQSARDAKPMSIHDAAEICVNAITTGRAVEKGLVDALLLTLAKETK